MSNNTTPKGRRALIKGAALLGLLGATIVVAQSVTHAQGRWGRRYRGTPSYEAPILEAFPGNRFTFCTVDYESVRSEPLGFGWNTDYPDAGDNFMTRLAELTTIDISREEWGGPHQEVLALTDAALVNYPYIFMSDVGTAEFSPEEITRLRAYLLRGGFLHVDDFWGERAWDNWEYEIAKVLPPDQYPIEDIPLTDDIFHIVFDVWEVPQVPSIQHWEWSGGSTSERGEESAIPHLRGIRDKHERWMVVMSHNTDIADGWEKERASEEFFREFSVKKSYPLGINIVVYAMTH